MTDVKGYTPLSEAQKQLANEGKELEERVLRWLDKVDQAGVVNVMGIPAGEHPKAFVMLGRRSIQQGFMWAVRSIFQPQRIRLPEDPPDVPSA